MLTPFLFLKQNIFKCAIVMVVTLSGNLGLLAQSAVPIVHNLSYTVESRSYYKLQQGKTILDVDPIDAFPLKSQSKVEVITNYLDINQNPITTYRLISHENVHPKWYVPAELIVFDADGIRFQNNATMPSPDDDFIEYEAEDLELYQVDKIKIINDGFLNDLSFKMPTSDQINTVAGLGVQTTLSPDGNEVSFVIDSRSETWNLQNKTKVSITPQQSEDGFLRVTHYYSFNAELGIDVLSTVVMEQDIILAGGICAKKVTIDQFKNYNINPSQDNHESGLRSESIMISEPSFTISPNPTRADLMQISVQPEWVGQVVIAKVINPLGQPVFQAQLSFSSEKQYLKLNPEHLPPGLYYLALHSNGLVQSQPFYITF